MSSESAQPTGAKTIRFAANEVAYLGARTFLLVALSILYAAGIMRGEPALDHTLYLVGLAVLAIDWVAFVGLVLGARWDFSRAMMAIVVPDLVMMGLFSYLGRPEDSFYPVIILAPIFYALVVSRRNAVLVGLSAAVAYAIAVAFVGPQSLADILLYSVKIVVVPVATALVASAVEVQRSREERAEQSAFETDRLNSQLRKRVRELQAVSEISEIIHSSLDFDAVGPQVLEIIATALRVKVCCLFVVDKDRSETLFSASRGTATMLSEPPVDVLYAETDDEHLTCIPVFDHGSTMVLFCATAPSLSALSDEERLVLGAVASELVVAVENSRLYKLTSMLAITDELTGLANYRHLQQRLDEELARAGRYTKSVSLLMMDADDFKAFNDAYGHVAGDIALAELGTIMRGLVREVDLVARYGGEEFSVVLPETDAPGAYVVAEKIREAVQTHSFADADGVRRCSLTVSVGAATFPAHCSDKNSLLREADDALYHAKRGSKNRVRTPQRHTRPESAEAPTEAHAKTDEWTGA